jgi:hypothetical protein
LRASALGWQPPSIPQAEVSRIRLAVRWYTGPQPPARCPHFDTATRWMLVIEHRVDA